MTDYTVSVRLSHGQIAAAATPAVSTLLARLALWFVAGFLAISTFEGALRYYAAQAGLPWLVYVKDIMLIGAIAMGFTHGLHSRSRNFPFLLVLAFMTVGLAVGLYTLPDPRQPIFAAKTWLPLLCGAAVGPMIDPRSKFLIRTCSLLWFCAVAGVVATSLWRAPWEGFVYEVGGMAVEGSREWSIGEARRVAGFSRASFDAALQCVFFGAIVVAALRNYIFSVFIWLVSAVGLYLALSRSAMIALFAAILLHFLATRYLSLQRAAKLLVIALAACAAAIPFLAGYYYKNKATLVEYQDVISTSSFEERATKTWPDGLALPAQGGNWVFGRGLGGIGVGQQFFEPSRFNPGDNLFIYLWAAFGSIGALFLLFTINCVWRAQVPLNRRRQTAIVIVGSFLAVGLTLNAIEAAIASLFFGISLVWLIDRADRAGSPQAQDKDGLTAAIRL